MRSARERVGCVVSMRANESWSVSIERVRGVSRCGSVALLVPARERLAVAPVRRWHVDVDRLERRSTRVPDLMRNPTLDEEERSRLQLVALAIHDRHPAPGDDEQPLIGAAVPA